MNNAASTTTHARDLTVVVSCYNHDAYIEQCLDSIAAQTVPPRQVIVIDDCSKDSSADVISRWVADHDLGYTFIRHEKNVGVCATLNEGIVLAEGTFFCHVSGDDWEEPERFHYQVDLFETLDEDVALLVGDIREVDAGGGTITEHDYSRRVSVVTAPSTRAGALSALLAENRIPAPGTMLRTAALRAVGGFDETLAFEDYDMWMRLATEYAMAYGSGIVCNYRVVDSGLTRNVDRRVSVLTSEADMLAKHIGNSPQDDAIIVSRLLPIAGEIMLLGSTPAVRHVLGAAMSASREPWIRGAYRASRTKWGLRNIIRTRAMEFSISPHAKSADSKAPEHR